MREDITVVSGVPRSGTSLVMQMLQAGGVPLLVDGVRPADEHNPRGYFEYEPVKGLAGDASWLPQARGRAVKVIHVLLRSLPEGFDYRVILVRRDLRQVVASQDAMLAGGAGAPAGPAGERLAEIYAQQLQEIEAWLEDRQRLRVLRVEHAALVADPLATARAIAAFLELDGVAGAMAAAVDGSLFRSR